MIFYENERRSSINEIVLFVRDYDQDQIFKILDRRLSNFFELSQEDEYLFHLTHHDKYAILKGL